MPTLALNKRARFDYELIEHYEGGLALTGAEVKAAKKGSIDMKGAFLSIVRNELWVKNLYIGKYAPAGKQEGYREKRDRKVLVHRREIKTLLGKKKAQGLTIVPIRVYMKGNLVKLEFAVARGKRKYEKRADIKKRDLDRHAREEMKKTRFAD
jgi:SsrA-binding protein